MLATFCLILRGAFPAQAAGAQLTGCGEMPVQSAHAECAMHHPSIAMNEMGKPDAATNGMMGKAEQPQHKLHGEGCHGCPPSLSCTTGHVALGATVTCPSARRAGNPLCCLIRLCSGRPATGSGPQTAPLFLNR
ncbi:hypothetical protein QE368_001053 [Asaia bogorensis NBRC 16594]|nr:hypothetical protein [Asaia bogorensis NBRC 16594]